MKRFVFVLLAACSQSGLAGVIRFENILNIEYLEHAKRNPDVMEISIFGEVTEFGFVNKDFSGIKKLETYKLHFRSNSELERSSFKACLDLALKGLDSTIRFSVDADGISDYDGKILISNNPGHSNFMCRVGKRL